MAARLESSVTVSIVMLGSAGELRVRLEAMSSVWLSHSSQDPQMCRGSGI